MKEIPQYPKYQISEDGRTVWNDHTKRELKLRVDKKGYVWVTLLLTEGGYRLKGICVHRLVAYTYLGKPEDSKKVWVNHKDGNKGNNHYSNLEWTTIGENIQHSYSVLGRKVAKGKGHWRYGVRVGKVTRNRMSKKKIGALHPKFKGWYEIKGNRYGSTYEAWRETGVGRHTIYRYCHAGIKGYKFIAKGAIS